MNPSELVSLINMSNSKVEIIRSIFKEFVKETSKEKYDKLDSKYIFSHKSWVWNNKMSLKKLLILSEINPDCILKNKRGLYKESNSFLFDIMDELEVILGRKNLNRGTIENHEKITPPPSLRTKGSFPLSEKFDFPLRKVTPESIVVSLERVFKIKWDDILIKTKRSDVKRKIAKYSIGEVYTSFVESLTKLYNCSESKLMEDPFNLIKLKEIKVHDNRLTSLLNKFASRILDKTDKKILKLLEDESDLVISIQILIYYNQNKNLKEINHYIKNVNDFKDKTKKINVIKKRKDNIEQNQKDILSGYSNGYFGYGDYFGEKTLYRYINHSKDNTDRYFKKIGIELDSLKNLKNQFDRKYNSRQKVLSRFRELVRLSIKNNTNYLTREWVENNDPDLIKDSFCIEKIKTNSWEKVLKIYGLNPMIWNNSYPTVSYRGFVFEKSIKKIFESKFNEVKNLDQLGNSSFIYNKLVSKGIKPDFIFSKLLIDTKFSVKFDKSGVLNKRVSNQLEKYIDFFNKRIIILTFNQTPRKIITYNKKIEVEIINLKQLQNFCYRELNYKISKKEITEVYENINSVPFWKRT